MFTSLSAAEEANKVDFGETITVSELKRILPPTVLKSLAEYDELQAKRDQLYQNFSEDNKDILAEAEQNLDKLAQDYDEDKIGASEFMRRSRMQQEALEAMQPAELQDLDQQCNNFKANSRIELEGPVAGQGTYLECHISARGNARIHLVMGEYQQDATGQFQAKGTDHNCASVTLQRDENGLFTKNSTSLYRTNEDNYLKAEGGLDTVKMTRDTIATLKIFKHFEEKQDFTSLDLERAAHISGLSIPEISDKFTNTPVKPTHTPTQKASF